MSKTTDIFLRGMVTAFAVGAVIIHEKTPKLVDPITVGLIIVALIPWLGPIIKSVEIPGVGKLELQVQDVESKQKQLKQQVDGLRFLVSYFVTDFELKHLKKLGGNLPFPYKRSPSRDDKFINEIVRLRDLGLVQNKDGTISIHNIPLSDDLTKYVEITDRGRNYMHLREELAIP